MKLKFPPFQRFIQLRVVPKIVSRANDSVVKSLDVSDTTIIVQVRGSKLHNVEIVFDQEEVVKVSCNCPYDYSGYCKHIVNVLKHADPNRKQSTIDTCTKPSSNYTFLIPKKL